VAAPSPPTRPAAAAAADAASEAVRWCPIVSTLATVTRTAATPEGGYGSCHCGGVQETKMLGMERGCHRGLGVQSRGGESESRKDAEREPARRMVEKGKHPARGQEGGVWRCRLSTAKVPLAASAAVAGARQSAPTSVAGRRWAVVGGEGRHTRRSAAAAEPHLPAVWRRRAGTLRQRRTRSRAGGPSLHGRWDQVVERPGGWGVGLPWTERLPFFTTMIPATNVGIVVGGAVRCAPASTRAYSIAPQRVARRSISAVVVFAVNMRSSTDGGG